VYLCKTALVLYAGDIVLRRFLVLVSVVLVAVSAFAAERVRVAVDLLRPGEVVSGHFLGLSYETSQMLQRADGTHYFSPTNKALVTLFRTLGVKSLRIGGNSVDKPLGGPPTEADIDSLFGFARAAGVKVIFSVRLEDGDVQDAARQAKYIHGHYAELLDCFAVGNEPSYLKPYEKYRERWKAMVDAMMAVAPGAKFCGPDTNPNAEWCKKLVEEFGGSGWFSMITEHDYPGGASYSNTNAASVKDLIPIDPAPVREKMMSTDWQKRYATVLKSMTDAVAGTSVPYRMTETNSLWYGGLEGASDSYASAMWSIDYMYWWAQHGTKGLNFHTGDRAGGGDKSLPSRYTAFVTAGTGYDVHPLSYGMKVFDLGGRGRMVPVTVVSGDETKFSAFATTASDGEMSLTFLNRTHGAGGVEMEVEVDLPESCAAKDVKMLLLTAPNGDIAAKTGLTLGGAAIEPDGRWDGRWSSVKVAGNTINVRVPAASAAVVRAKACGRS
jgi:hypothetical protein